MMRPPTLKEVEFLVAVINAQSGTDEPILLSSPADRARLQRCLSYALRWPIEGGQKPQPERCAARLYYSIAKGRPLADGNKRLAQICTAACLIGGGFVPNWSPQEMYEIATRDDDQPGEASKIVEDLSLLIFSNIRYVDRAARDAA
jgi:prophage maintenance system killer protein